MMPWDKSGQADLIGSARTAQPMTLMTLLSATRVQVRSGIDIQTYV